MDVNEAVEYLKKQDLANMEIGKYVVNDDFYFLIQEYDSKDPEVAKMETHRVYTDIQWVLSGREIIETAPLDDRLVEKIPYNPEKDIEYWENPAHATRIEMHAGDYQIFTPDIAHRPGMRFAGEAERVKKCVGKVK